MKKLLTLLCLFIAVICLSGCSNQEEPIQKQEEKEEVVENTSSKSLVAYFSCTGNTEKVAKCIQEATNGDLYEIVPVELYTNADLDYHDDNSRTSIEMNDESIRVEIEGSISNFNDYDTIYIGYPIWWGEAPRIIDTFVESYDFTNKTVIPFCTSGGSGVGSSDSRLEKLAGTGNWKEGRKFSSSVTVDEIKEWIE